MNFLFCFSARFLNTFDPGDDFLDFFVTEQDCVKHFFFGNDVCARLDHHDCVFRSRKAQMELALFAFRGRGVDDIFAVNVSDDNRRRGACERNVGNAERDRAAKHAEYLGRDFFVNRKRGCDDCDVVQAALREQGTNGTVDKTRRKYRLIGRSAFSLFEAAGDFAHCEHFFFEVNAEREKIDSVTGCFCHRSIGKDDGFAASYETTAVCLTAVRADFNGDFASADFGFENFSFHILCPPKTSAIPARSPNLRF